MKNILVTMIAVATMNALATLLDYLLTIGRKIVHIVTGAAFVTAVAHICIAFVIASIMMLIGTITGKHFWELMFSALCYGSGSFLVSLITELRTPIDQK